jgi:hypothetical protein
MDLGSGFGVWGLGFGVCRGGYSRAVRCSRRRIANSWLQHAKDSESGSWRSVVVAGGGDGTVVGIDHN